MLMLRKFFIAVFSTAVLAACSHSEVNQLHKYDFSGLDPMTDFIPYGAPVFDALTETKFKACPLPCGSKVRDEYEELTKTTSTNGTALFKNVISCAKSNELESFTGTYLSVDQYGNPITLSGRIILPADHNISRIMVVSHFTIGADIEAPSNELPMESIFALRGLAVIEPDYLGYGITRNLIHPYLCSELTATNVADMYFAALPFLEKIGCAPRYPDIFLLGFSQGGATTMATLKHLERDHKDVKVRLAMAGGGPYDIGATYDTLIENDFSDYPCAIPMIIQGMKEGMLLPELEYESLFTKTMCDNMDEWINSKKYTMQDITALMGSKYISTIMTENARDKATPGMTDLYRVMLENSLCNWYPSDPVYLFHSIDDNVVPFINAYSLQKTLSGTSNVIYNFGHYGNHVKACLRFMFSCLTLLESNGDI